jgi:oligoendopeptidase F
MKALALSQYRSLYGDTAHYAKLEQLYGMLTSLLVSTMYTEFEIWLYENSSTASARRNSRFSQLSTEYGIPEVHWQSIPHFYQFPLYYISYAFGEIAAIELWGLIDDDLWKAKEMYLSYIRGSMELDLVMRLDNAGFSNPFDIRTPETLADYLDGIFNNEEYWSMNTMDRVS